MAHSIFVVNPFNLAIQVNLAILVNLESGDLGSADSGCHMLSDNIWFVWCKRTQQQQKQSKSWTPDHKSWLMKTNTGIQGTAEEYSIVIVYRAHTA